MAAPTPGELFERSYVVGDVTIEVLAEVEVDGSTLHLRNLAVFPADIERANVGAAAVLRVLRDELLSELAGYGFTEVRVTATRLSGSSPGRSLELLIRLPEDLP